MAQHITTRPHRPFPDLKIAFHAPITISSLLADRLALSQTVHDPPKCICIRGLSLPECDLASVFSRFNLISFAVCPGCIRTFHRDDASVSALATAFENCPNATLLSESSEFRDRVIDIVIQKLIDAATADCRSCLVQELARLVQASPESAAKRSARRRRLPNRKEFAAFQVDFESIRQPEIDCGSSRLTPCQAVPEWNRRAYLRPCAQARQFPFLLARKNGGRLLYFCYLNG
jgi:hypothetical protein